jgi:hypothetical protein
MSRNSDFLEELSIRESSVKKEDSAGSGFDILANVKWFVREQRKILSFTEGVFILMLSLALVLNELTLVLWTFSISQVIYGIVIGLQRGQQIEHNRTISVEK